VGAKSEAKWRTQVDAFWDAGIAIVDHHAV
jgi:hypothetical protein